ncbi:MAG TPA: molybdopterin-dependent oxidoreductase, partial [Candidatus Limnocylindrales bacterium]|nr:molybdopterin-dependent oxidoreductase [Candidatus Limnocylindrales bacterium]
KSPTGSLPVDRVVRTTCSPNCTGSCGQLAFVRDEKIVKIQQAADYPDAAYNPRGCMKGLSYHLQVHGPDRIMTPLIREGELGSGDFREATWDEVLDLIASRLKQIGETHGWDSIHVFGQVPGSGYIQKGANYRACALLGMSHGTSFDFNGDLPMGMPITFGVQNAEHEAKDWANSRFLLLIGANPVETRIPDVHFLWDAVEKGARLVVVDPVFSGTAAKADVWLQPKPGTDAALALAMAHVIVAENLADLEFMRAYTDAPLLVRDDSHRRLRMRDIGRDLDPDLPERFIALGPAGVLHGAATDHLGSPAPGAALDGETRVALADGTEVTARPGFVHVRRELEKWTPERAAEVTGIAADRIVALARAYATEKPAAILMGGGANHWFHGDLTGRAFALLAALTGNVGRSGGGFSVYVGQYKVRVDTSPWWSPGGTKAPVVPSIYFVRGRTPTMHEKIPYPAAGFKALVCTFANMFLQSPDVNRLHETLRGLELIVVVDHQMTDTVKWADVVLPATTWYEKTDLTATPLHPFLQLQQPAIAPVGESRSEVAIWREIIRRIDPALAAEWFDIDEEEAIRQILEAGGGPGGPTEGITLEDLKAGPVRLRVPDPDVPFLAQVRDLVPFPPRSLPAPLEATAAFVPTGRIEFYKEEDRFLELDEQVPTYREPYDDGIHDPASFPLVLLSPHSKWRIHSTYSNNAWLAEIHGGRPKVLLHPDDAAARGIADGDTIRVHNTRGSLEAWAHVTEAAGPGTATLPEGWWSRYFRSGKGVNELTSSEVNPIHEIHFVANMWSPSTGWKDCRCEVEKSDGARDA